MKSQLNSGGAAGNAALAGVVGRSTVQSWHSHGTVLESVQSWYRHSRSDIQWGRQQVQAGTDSMQSCLQYTLFPIKQTLHDRHNI